MNGHAFAPAPESGAGRILRWIVGVAIFGLTSFAASIVLLPPKLAYEVDGEMLRVEARVGLWPLDRAWPLERVERAEVADARLVWRVAGTGMPGFCEGHFRAEPDGDVTVATDCGRGVVRLAIRGEPRPVLLSPADGEAFVEAIRVRRVARFAPTARGGTVPAWHALQVVVALLPPLVLAVFFLGPRRLRYRIVGGRLWIYKLVGRRDVSLTGVTARRERPSKVRRVVGTALPGYYGGRFRIDGRPGLVFASRLDEGVLIEGDDLRLFVTPADAEAFVAAVTRVASAR